MLPLQQEVKRKETETSLAIDSRSCQKVPEELRLSLSQSIKELKGAEKQIELEEFTLQVFVNMVEEGEKELSKAIQEYTKSRTKCERYSNNVECNTLWIIGLV